MATRGSYGFKMNGIIKATYNHHDSYPEYLGKKLFLELQSILEKKNATETLRKAFNRIEMVNESERVVPLEIWEMYVEKKWVQFIGQSNRDLEWYNFLHDWQGTMMPYVEYEKPYMIDIEDFDRDCLEYEYIVDLDNESFISRECCEGGIVFAVSFSDIRNSSETDYLRLWSLMEDNKIERM